MSARRAIWWLRYDSSREPAFAPGSASRRSDYSRSFGSAVDHLGFDERRRALRHHSLVEGEIVARHPLDAKACLERGAHAGAGKLAGGLDRFDRLIDAFDQKAAAARSEEHTSELQSLAYLVCRLLLEKKKQSVYDRRDHE